MHLCTKRGGVKPSVRTQNDFLSRTSTFRAFIGKLVASFLVEMRGGGQAQPEITAVARNNDIGEMLHSVVVSAIADLPVKYNINEIGLKKTLGF
jgi:hypothetical protein